MPQSPGVVVLGGPNGAGKTTSASHVLQGALKVDEFVNADTLAQGLSAFRPDTVGVEAARLMLERLDRLEDQRKSFAFEATLASHALTRRLRRLGDAGYSVNLIFLWLPSVDLSLARVAGRTRLTGHHVPEEMVRRRFDRGRRHFFSLYRALARRWRFYDASAVEGPRLIATGGADRPTHTIDAAAWQQAAAGTDHEQY